MSLTQYKENTQPFIVIDGQSYSLDEVLIALGKVLVKKGVISKAEIVAEL